MLRNSKGSSRAFSLAHLLCARAPPIPAAAAAALTHEVPPRPRPQEPFASFPPLILSATAAISKVLSHLRPLISVDLLPALRSPFSTPRRSSFGIAFDIDGVILRGRTPIGGSPQALRRLYTDDGGSIKIPFLFLTNGGSIPETKRASKLSGLPGVQISPLQTIQDC